MAENIDIEVTGFTSLKTQIKEATLEYQRLLQTVGATPAAIDAAARKVGDLKEQLGDVNDTTNAFTNQGKFQAVTKSLGAVAGGFTAIQGAISLAGGDAKDFEKTFQRVQGAMALTQGLTALADLGDAFGNLKKVAVASFNAIKVAIGSTGIGLLVIALGAIYAFWDDIKAAVIGVSAEQQKLNEDTAANLAMQQKQLDAISAQENILKLQGKTEEEIYQIKIDQYDATIKAGKAQLIAMEATEKAQVDAAKRNKDILQGIIRFLTIPLTALLATVDLVGKALGQDFGLEEKFSGGLAGLLFDPEDIKKKADVGIEEAKKALTKLENERAGLIVQHDAKRDAEQKTRDDKAAAARQKEEEAQLTHLQQIQALRDKYGELIQTDEDARARKALESQQRAAMASLQVEIDAYENKKKLTKDEAKTLAVLRQQQDQLRLNQNQETLNLLQAQDEKANKKNLDDQKILDDTLIIDLQAREKLEISALKTKYDELAKLEQERVVTTHETLKVAGEEDIHIMTTSMTEGNKARLSLQDAQALEAQAIRDKYAKLAYDKEEEALKKEEDLKVKAAIEIANKVLDSETSTEQEKRNAQEKLERDLIQLDINGAVERIKIAKKLGLDTLQLEIDLVAKLNGVYQQDTANYATEFLKKNEVAIEQLQGFLTAATSVINAIADYQKMKNQEEIERIKAKYLEQQTLLDENYAKDIAAAEAAGTDTTAIKEEYAYQASIIEYNQKMEEYKLGKKGFESNKGVQIAQALIAGIQGAIASYTSLAGIPVVGPVLGGIAAAAAAASAAFQVATIRKTTFTGTPPVMPEKKSSKGGGSAGAGEASAASKFAYGGLLNGPKHEEGGIPTEFGQLEGGEFVVNRSATAAFLPLLDKINSMGSGSGALTNTSSSAESVINQERQQQIIKTYVVASEMASQMEAEKRISDIARL